MKKPVIRKGFTLAELLIVVAIIAVLVAVAIPIFNKQIEKSREAYDIATMRQAAAAATELYYLGINDKASADAAGLRWWWEKMEKKDYNAAGVYVPGSGKFRPDKATDKKVKPYGKGTTVDGGTQFTMGNSDGAYAPKSDYKEAVVMVSVFPYAERPYLDVYWKSTKTSGAAGYIGGYSGNNQAKYSLRVYLD